MESPCECGIETPDSVSHGVGWLLELLLFIIIIIIIIIIDIIIIVIVVRGWNGKTRGHAPPQVKSIPQEAGAHE